MKIQNKTEKKASSLLIWAGGLFWIIMIAVGFFFLGREQFTPVPELSKQVSFPSDSQLSLDPKRLSLFVFLHPQCPCSRATLRELDRLMANTGDKLPVTVIFTLPEGVPTDWEKGTLWNTAEKMPGVHVLLDQGGTEALRLGANGSGQVLLYNPSGKLLFSGGITSSRAHEGDNDGERAIAQFVHQGHALITQTPVFGCSLLNPQTLP